MTDEELKELVASLVIAQKETDRLLREQAKETDRLLKEQAKEADRLAKEADRRFREAELQRKDTNKQIKEMSKQLGGLGNKFGSFTEGMAYPSMERLLDEKFGMTAISPNFKFKKDGRSLELDVFAYTNGELNQAFIVEVKSHVKEEHIEQLLMQLRELKTFAPEHKDKQIFGILSGVSVPDNMKQTILKNGLYLAMIHDEQFDLQVPKGFVGKAF